jgi:hypothetical protein
MFRLLSVFFFITIPNQVQKYAIWMIYRNIRIDYNKYHERAKYSKIGLIITEHSYIQRQGKAHPGQISIATHGILFCGSQ